MFLKKKKSDQNLTLIGYTFEWYNNTECFFSHPLSFTHFQNSHYLTLYIYLSVSYFNTTIFIVIKLLSTLKHRLTKPTSAILYYSLPTEASHRDGNSYIQIYILYLTFLYIENTLWTPFIAFYDISHIFPPVMVG